jgi:hypothetical protein
MSRPGIEPGPPVWEASTIEKSHVDSLITGYSEPLLGLRPALHPLHPASTWLPPVHAQAWTFTGCSPNSPLLGAMREQAL